MHVLLIWTKPLKNNFEGVKTLKKLSKVLSCGWRWWNNGRSYLAVGTGGKIKAGRGWSWEVASKLWLVVDGHRWYWQNYGWSWVVMDGRGWSHDFVMPIDIWLLSKMKSTSLALCWLKLAIPGSYFFFNKVIMKLSAKRIRYPYLTTQYLFSFISWQSNTVYFTSVRSYVKSRYIYPYDFINQANEIK